MYTSNTCFPLVELTQNLVKVNSPSTSPAVLHEMIKKSLVMNLSEPSLQT